MHIGGTAIHNNFNKRMGVLDLPFMWKNYDHAHHVIDGKVGQTLAAEHEKLGLKVLGWQDSWGYRNVVTTKKEVKKPEDLKGLKIRTIQTPTYVAALNAMGASATPMAFGEVYTSLQTGVLDGFEHSSAVIYTGKYYEVAKYITLTEHLFGPTVTVISKKEWDGYTDKEKAVVAAAAKLGQDVNRSLSVQRDAESMQKLKDKGMIVNPIDKTQFLKAAGPLQDQLAKTDRRRGPAEDDPRDQVAASRPRGGDPCVAADDAGFPPGERCRAQRFRVEGDFHDREALRADRPYGRVRAVPHLLRLHPRGRAAGVQPVRARPAAFLERGVPEVRAHLDGDARHPRRLPPRRAPRDGHGAAPPARGRCSAAWASLTEVLWFLLALAIGRYTLVIMAVAKSQDSPGLGIPMDDVYAGMVIGATYLAFVALRRFATYFGWQDPPPAPLGGSALMLAGLFVLLLALITLGVPILLVMGIVGLAGILATPTLVPALFPQKMFAMLDNFSLLALPYFILAGELISAGGISRKLVEFAETVVGHWRGGLGHASVVSSMVFAGVSGSSVADTSAIGSILVPAMKDHGYKPGFAAALVACAGTIGAIIPPSMTMIVYGSMANVSIGGLFLGGIVPGILIGVGLMLGHPASTRCARRFRSCGGRPARSTAGAC